MKKKKGFTLIELLAVIVILAIIALIATPVILNIIEKSRKAAFTRSAENVLKASNTYYALTLMDGEFENISFECDGTKCLSSKLDNNGNLIDLNVEGNMGKGTVNIDSNGIASFELTNGAYCATKTVDSSKIEVTKGNCGQIDPKDDTTKPEIKNVSYTKTNNSIKIVVSAKDSESGISYYEYSIDDGLTWTEKQTSNIYEYKNLSLGTYKIKVKVYNGAYEYSATIGMTESETKEVTLEVESCPIPEILSEEPVGWAKSKEVTIDYGNVNGCIGSYSIDNGTTFIEGTTVTTSNKNIILKNTAGTKDYTISYSLKIDNEEPTLTIGEVTSDKNSITIPFTVSDTQSGVKSTTCEYGKDETYGNNGTIENNKCILSNLDGGTTYYYKVTSMDNVENSKSITGSKEITTYIEMVYYNPTTGNRCTESEYNTNLQNHIDAGNPTATNLKSGCMKWYAYKDNGSTYDMILDHNTTATVQYNSDNVNTSQKEVAQALSEDTAGWTVTARLITAPEIRNITGNAGTDPYYFNGKSNGQTKGSNEYYWLFDYTSGCISFGCNEQDNNFYTVYGSTSTMTQYGYWTSTPHTGNSNNVWRVDRGGYLDNYSANGNYYGLRPVITISK